MRSVRNERISNRAQCSSDQMRLLVHAVEYRDRRIRRPLIGRASQAVSPPAHQPTSAHQTRRVAWLFQSSVSFCRLTGDEASGRSQRGTCSADWRRKPADIDTERNYVSVTLCISCICRSPDPPSGTAYRTA